MSKSALPYETEDSTRQSAPDSHLSYPRISVVTPSYNQAPYLEETIRSVLSQDYPNLEYMIIDGGSDDGSVDIIRQYEGQLAYWVSEPDHGQSDAINKGWRRATGDVIAWLNSDDTYYPRALQRVGAAFAADPDLAMVYGDCNIVGPDGAVKMRRRMEDFETSWLALGIQLPQPSVFLHRRVLEEVGKLDEELHWAMDTDLFLRTCLAYPPQRRLWLPHVLSASRDHPLTKTNTGVERISHYRRVALRRIFALPEAQAQIGHLEAVAFSNTYWREATRLLIVGRRRHALRSMRIALRTAPRNRTILRLAHFATLFLLPENVVQWLRHALRNIDYVKRP